MSQTSQVNAGGAAAAQEHSTGELASAGVAALMGNGRIQQATPPVPTEAAGSMKADVEEIKERARR